MVKNFILYSECFLTKASYVTLLGSLFISNSALAACSKSGTTATCSGVTSTSFFSTEDPVATITSVDTFADINTVTITPTANVSSSGVSRSLIELVNPSGPGTNADLTITADTGSVINQTEGTFAFYLRNLLSGTNEIVFGGAMSSTLGGGIRLWGDNTQLPDSDTVRVLAGASIVSEQTGVWIRHRSGARAPALVEVAGTIQANTIRAVHISANGAGVDPNTDPDATINVSATGVVEGGEQGLYIGVSGFGTARFIIDGAVRGGSGADLGNFGPTGAMIAQAEQDVDVSISSTGSVSSLNDHVFANLDAGINTAAEASLSFSNNGTITGYITAGAAGDSIVNRNIWVLRNWTDSNNDGIADTKADIINNIGSGPNQDSVLNEGEMIVASVGNGIDRVRFTDNVELINSGSIYLTEDRLVNNAPIAGDEFIISGQYTGTGGSIFLDVDFSTDQADSLEFTVDKTSGTNTTTIHITDASLAAATGNDVEVIKASSINDNNSFQLAAPGYIDSGGFRYGLERDTNTGNWFLRASPLLAGPAGILSVSSPNAIPTLSYFHMIILSSLIFLALGRSGFLNSRTGA